MHTLLSICCKTPYLYSIQFWGMCIMYMEIGFVFHTRQEGFWVWKNVPKLKFQILETWNSPSSNLHLKNLGVKKKNRNDKTQIGGSSNMEELINVKFHPLFPTKTSEREDYQHPVYMKFWELATIWKQQNMAFVCITPACVK